MIKNRAQITDEQILELTVAFLRAVKYIDPYGNIKQGIELLYALTHDSTELVNPYELIKQALNEYRGMHPNGIGEPAFDVNGIASLKFVNSMGLAFYNALYTVYHRCHIPHTPFDLRAARHRMTIFKRPVRQLGGIIDIDVWDAVRDMLIIYNKRKDGREMYKNAIPTIRRLYIKQSDLIADNLANGL